MDAQKKNVSWKRKIFSAIITFFCVAVTICVVYVLFFIMDPDRNSRGAFGSACMDVVCMIILFILVASITFRQEEIGRTTKLFLTLMLGTKAAVFFDFLTWSLDGTLEYGNVTFLFTIASLCSGAILACIFVNYLANYMNDKYGLSHSFLSAKICTVFNIGAFVLTITLAILKKAFVFVDGHYATGVLYNAITVIPILTLLYFTGYVIKHGRIMGFHDVFSVVMYIFIMIVGAVTEAILGIGTSYVAISIADVFIFVMLQNNLLAKTKLNAERWMKKSNTDEVTGFYNRHAYEDAIAALETRTDRGDFVYVSMDVNGLKIINDTLGHEAGDELIVGACSCMERCFGPYGKLYRTGGDEFAALIFATAFQLGEIKKQFAEETEKWSGELIDNLTISCGFVTAKEAGDMTIHQMAVLADKRMYENKTRYYQTKGIDRRGQRDAHVALCALYTKILKVNLTDDTYQIENMNPDERTAEKGFSDKLSKWLYDFGVTGQVHPEDLEEYLANTSIEYISGYFKRNNTSLRVFYRRKYQNDYKHVMMELIPANDYSDETQNLFLYVKNIEK